jgi:hypothetical protein
MTRAALGFAKKEFLAKLLVVRGLGGIESAYV